MPADIKTIFLAATEKPLADRAAFLAETCGADSGLRRRVEALLKAHDESGGWLGEPGTPTSDYPGFSAPGVAELAPLFPQLEILELLGQGGMGAVYKARQRNLDRYVALKILPHESGDKGFADRFTREARTLAKLSHPGIVAVHDFGSSEGLYWFVMEYVDGVNLRQAKKAGSLTPVAALAIVPQICEALQFAHDAGIVHRDIKPENVLLDARGRVKIADFGLAKLLGRTELSNLTGTNQAMGTPHYMAPEQWERPLEVDHRADIYSLGVVFYELLTGELPVGRFDPPSKKVQIDVRLDEVVLRTLEKEPGRRYQQAGEVKTDVERISQTAKVFAEPDEPLVRTAPARVTFFRNVVAPLLYLFIVGVLSSLGLLFLFKGWDPGVQDVTAAIAIVAVYFVPALFLILFVRWSASHRQQSVSQMLNGIATSFRLYSLTSWAILICTLGAANAWLPWCTELQSGLPTWLGSFDFVSEPVALILGVFLTFLAAGFVLFITAVSERLRLFRIILIFSAALLTLVLTLVFFVGVRSYIEVRRLNGFLYPTVFFSLGLSVSLLFLGALDMRGWLASGRQRASQS